MVGKNENYNSINGTNATTPTGTNVTSVPEFDWDDDIQGKILSAYFIGYSIIAFPAGHLVKKFGSRSAANSNINIAQKFYKFF